MCCGLFVGKYIKFGNNVSEDGGNKCVFVLCLSDFIVLMYGFGVLLCCWLLINDLCCIFVCVEFVVDGF